MTNDNANAFGKWIEMLSKPDTDYTHMQLHRKKITDYPHCTGKRLRITHIAQKKDYRLPTLHRKKITDYPHCTGKRLQITHIAQEIYMLDFVYIRYTWISTLNPKMLNHSG